MQYDITDILEALNSSVADTRESALDQLGELNPSNALDLIGPFLGDSDPEVRGTAAANLGIIRNERTIPYLVEASASDPNEAVRAEALTSLGEYRSSEILDRLVDEVYREKRSRRPRQEVARQLGDYDDEKAVLALIELLHDEDVFVRDYAAESLFRLNRPSLRDVWEIALNDQSHDVREIAIKALDNLNEAS